MIMLFLNIITLSVWGSSQESNRYDPWSHIPLDVSRCLLSKYFKRQIRSVDLPHLGSNLSHNTSTWSWRREGGCHEQTWTSTCGSLRCTARRATWVCTGTSKEVPHINPHEAFPTLELMFCLRLKRTSRVKSVFTMDYNSLNRDSQVTCSASWAALENWVKLLEQKCEPGTEAGSKSNSTFFGLFCVLIVPCWKSVLFYLKSIQHFCLLMFLFWIGFRDSFSPRPTIPKRAANSCLLIKSI